MNKLLGFCAILLLCSFNSNAQQDIGCLILSDFEKELYSSSQGTVLNYRLIDSYQLGLSGEFLQVFEVESVSVDKSIPSKKALVISHSPRREFLGRHDFIDIDEIDDLINGLAYFLEFLEDSKPKDYQSFLWTSRGGYQIQATCSLDFPKRYILTSKVDAFNSTSNGVVVFRKKVERLVEGLKAAKKILN